jgi:hypothetical protein
VAFIVITLHIIYSIVVSIGPYLTNNIVILSLFIINNTGIILLWYLVGHCFLTDLENYLLDIKKVTKNEDNFITKIFIRFFGENSKKFVVFFLAILPFINTCVCVYKIYHAKCEAIPKIES